MWSQFKCPFDDLVRAIVKILNISGIAEAEAEAVKHSDEDDYKPRDAWCYHLDPKIPPKKIPLPPWW